MARTFWVKHGFHLFVVYWLQEIGKIKAKGKIFGFVAGRFFHRPAGEDVIAAVLDLAAKAQGHTGQFGSRQVLGVGSVNPAIVQAQIDFVPFLVERHSQFVTQVPALLGGQSLFAVKAAHGVAVADAEELGGK